MLQILTLFISIILFSSTAFSQKEGCVFLEGLELPCYGGGVSCECGDYFTDEEMDEACRGTLTPAVTGCSNLCGRACCDTHCSTWNPVEHSVCEFCADCDGAIRGSIALSCDDPEAIAEGKNVCGTFTYGCGAGHQIECQGTGTVEGDPGGNCLVYQVSSAGANRCGQRVIGANPNICNGSPTGAPECGGFPNPCINTSSNNSCLGSTGECWVCSFTPGDLGKLEGYCAASSQLCIAAPPSQVKVLQAGCGYACPAGSIPEGDAPPYGDCSEVVSECANDGECFLGSGRANILK